jgi:hypothetical protein
MALIKSQPNASGPFLEAHQRYTRIGASRADDAALMAGFCAESLQLLVGAASPQLVWEAAQRKGMTTLALAELCNTNPPAVHDLMWE